MSYKFCEGCKWNIVDTVQICTNPKIQRSECPVITDYKVDLQGRLKFNAEEYTCKYYEPLMKKSDNEFSENMVVCAVGHLSPGNISDSCESCPHNKFSFPGVLIDGVTKDAVMLLAEKVEIVPEGTKARMEEMAAANGKMRSQIEGLQKNVLEFFDSTNATVAAGEKISIDYAHLKNRVSELEASNKELRELVCEFGLNIADQDYLLRPDTISRTISIMVEEKEKDGWYGNKLKEKQGGYSND